MQSWQVKSEEGFRVLDYATTSRLLEFHEGDLLAPLKLQILEEKVDEVVNSAQWAERGPGEKMAHYEGKSKF